jgi:phosphatidylserine/phosphatidylglycerophosphate/cardiolipin synthase-like enzyme
LLYVERRYLSNQFGKEQLARWFERAIADLQSAPPTNPPTALGTVRVAELRLRSNIVTHAKMVIDRDIEVVVLGSPYEQVYFDSQHVVDEPRRGGDASKGPIHEVSVAVRGGAVGHLQQLFNNHWNIAEPSDKLLDTPRLPRRPRAWTRTSSTCSVQIVRTLDSMFKPSTGGETCVLESYLRAIHFAKRFIYIENQYFNNDAITEALIEALARNVEVILLLNPAPDMPLYLGWQQKAIRRIAKSLSDNGINPDDWLGVFSAWTHATATAYLRSLLSPKEVPSDVVAEKGPGSYTFTYGAFPDTSVPGSRLASAESAAAISGSAAISDEAATT